MTNWIDIIRGTGIFLEGMGHGMMINRWMEMPMENALNSIEEFVKRASADQITSMDSALLSRSIMAIQPETRIILMKFYALFKIVEFARFGNFRGFPSTLVD